MDGKKMSHPLVLLEPGEVCDQLRISRSTLSEMLHRGELPCIRIRSGKRKSTFRIYEHALAEWLRKNKTQVSERS